MSHCLNPITIVNPKYDRNTHHGQIGLQLYTMATGDLDFPDDYIISVPCGKCIGCIRDKARSWRVRLLHEHMYGNHTSCICLTLTIAPEYYEKMSSAEDRRRAVAGSFRSFLDRLRYYCKDRKLPKRFFVSELGEKRGRLHFHGFVWDCPLSEAIFAKAWRYGFVGYRPLKSAKQLTYATKYISKAVHAHHVPYIFVSPGLGKGYLERSDWQAWHHSPDGDLPVHNCVRFDSFVYALPRYYREKIFTDDEVSRLKVVLSDPERPLKTFFAGREFRDRRGYQEARERMYESTVSKGISRPLDVNDNRDIQPNVEEFGDFNKYLFTF